MARQRFRLKLEELEGRDVPAASYLNGTAITVDFAPQGTSLFSESNVFYSTFGSLTNTAETEIMRAFQTWADVANINFGLIPSSGAGGSTPYSDSSMSSTIHIAAMPLSSAVGAISAPIGSLTSIEGDMLLNSSQSFSVAGSTGTYDLYTVALHETGILLGLPESTNSSSVMYSQYAGTRTGLSAVDITNIQALYGPRVAGAAEVGSGNNTFANAYNISSSAPFSGDLLKQTETDYFKFQYQNNSGATTITLKDSGLSLLEAKMVIMNDSGTVISTATATDPRSNTLSLTINNLPQESDYRLEILGANSSVFGMGEYTFTIVNASNPVQNQNPQPINTTLNLALNNNNYEDSLTAAGQVKQYTAHTPDSNVIGSSSNMIVTVSSIGTALNPQVKVYAGNGSSMSTDVLVEQNGMMTIEVLNVAPGQNYVVDVSSATGATGSYNMSLNFSSTPIACAQASGTLNAATPSAAGVLQVTQDQVMHFSLAGSTTNGTTTTSLQLTIWNSSDQLVATLTAASGMAQSFDEYLAPGNYSIEITASSTNKTTIAPITFQLISYVVSNPIAVQPANPNASPGSSTTLAPPPGISTTSGKTSVTSSLPSVNWASSFWWQTTPTGGTLTY